MPYILEQFYSEIKRKKKRTDEEDDSLNLQEDQDPNEVDCRDNYKNTTMKSIRGALWRYFKTTRSIDIISSENFIRANNVFQSVRNANKEVGLGVIKSYPPLMTVIYVN